MKSLFISIFLLIPTTVFSADSISLKSPELTHPFVNGFNLYYDAHTYGYLFPQSPSFGGFVVVGNSDGDHTALRMTGYIGTTAPTEAVVRITGAKSDGNGGSTYLQPHELIVEFVNSYPRATIYGDGTISNEGLVDTKGLVVNDHPIGKKGADLAIANDLTLGSDGDYFNVIGIGTVNALSSDWEDGRHVALYFGKAKVRHNAIGGPGMASMYLSGLKDTKGPILIQFIKDGNYWVEASRTVFQ